MPALEDLLKQSQQTGNVEQSNQTPEVQLLKFAQGMDKSLTDILDYLKDSEGSYKYGVSNRKSTRLKEDNTPNKLKLSDVNFKHIFNDFADNLDKAFTDSLVSSRFGDLVSKSLTDLAKGMDVEVRELPAKFGKIVGKGLSDKMKLSGKIDFSDKFEQMKSAASDAALKNQVKRGAYKLDPSKFVEGAEGQMEMAKSLNLKNLDLTDITASISSAMSAAGGMSGVLSMATAALVEFVVPILAITVVMKMLDEVIQPLKSAFEALTKILKLGNRAEEERKKNLEAANKRFEADVESLIRAPFEILADSAKKVEDAWDSTLRVISATQGYTKADVQDLMANFAERLRDEGLSSVVSGTDIVDSLSKVISSGLSGVIAEEFAYQATLLNAAIPTQDFFDFAATYSSIAANAIKDGKSQTTAINLANESLTSFADSLLYASRELAGGYSTGLKNAGELYTNAVKIAQAAKIGDASNIAKVLTSVSAIVGATAPDLANSITDAIVKAATGGNASSLVALRSLAGGNASNTEFLRALATNPQKVFTNLFTTLDTMFTDSSDAYMEKAEGYAELFGLSAEAFQRIDFKYLADAISNMKSTDEALSENMKMLKSGESTLTSEQLRIQQINKYMIDEGLAYVLDNEVARSIQQHMWDEQIAREITASTFAVELQGESANFLSSIASAVNAILNFLNPLRNLKKIVQIAGTSKERTGLFSDIKNALKAGVVGEGNKSLLSQYTSLNKNLNLIDDYLSLMGYESAYQKARTSRQQLLYGVNQLSGMGSVGGLLTYGLRDKSYEYGDLFSNSAGSTYSTKNKISSQYSWNISKSTARATTGLLSALLSGSTTSTNSVVTEATNASASVLAKKITQLLDADAISNFISGGGTYEDLISSAKSQGITDFGAALDAAGLQEQDVKNFFNTIESNLGAAEVRKQKETEQSFYAAALRFYGNDSIFSTTLVDPLFTHLSTIEDNQSTWLSAWGEFMTNGTASWEHVTTTLLEYVKSFADYFINRLTYDKAYNFAAVEEIQRKESQSQGDAIYALAEALTQNTVDLKDPTIQTNAILSQILVVASAILQQSNSGTGSLILPETFKGLGYGLVRES